MPRGAEKIGENLGGPAQEFTCFFGWFIEISSYARSDANLSTLLYGTYLGGSGTEVVFRPAFDSVGNIYLRGTTNSNDFPSTAGAYDTTHNGANDAFIMRLGDAGSEPDEVILSLQALIGTIDSLNSNVFKNKNMKKTYLNELNAVIKTVEAGFYWEAIYKLENDMRAKIDGCQEDDAPDNNDWILDCVTQNQVYPLVDDIVSMLYGLL